MAVSTQDFERVAIALRDLEEASVCRIVILPVIPLPYATQLVQFNVLHDEPGASEILDARDLDQQTLEDVADEVAETLTAVITNVGPDRYAVMRARRRRGATTEQTGDPDPEDEKKYRLAEQIFDITGLQARLWVKQTSKTLVPVTVEWELADKIADDNAQPPAGRPVRFGTLRIVGRPSRFNPFEVGDEALSMVVDREDVLLMLDILTRLRDAFDSTQ